MNAEIVDRLKDSFEFENESGIKLVFNFNKFAEPGYQENVDAVMDRLDEMQRKAIEQFRAIREGQQPKTETEGNQESRVDRPGLPTPEALARLHDAVNNSKLATKPTKTG